MYTLKEANTYIEENSERVIADYRNDYHLMAPIGWINDPNGFIYYKGEYHLFYQYYPYKSVWGPMHWGHSKSKDLISWEAVPVALAPDQTYDKDGCFSGTAIEKDGKIYLMYTGHILGETEEDTRQVQCIAVSSDGINFEKVKQNPVITEADLPENAKPQDFRDPKVIKKGDFFYSLIASKAKDGGGQILLYKSVDLLDWEFVSVMLKGTKDYGPMWECPDIFELDGKDILLFSIDGLPKKENNFLNTHSVLAITGRMNWENGIFDKETEEELDYGLDFYAPQTIEDGKNRRIMISWMQMWGRNIPTETEKHGWAGSMTLPRELFMKNNHVYQRPVSEIKNYYINRQSYDTIKLSDETKEFQELSAEVSAIELVLDVKSGKRFDIEVRSNADEKTLLTYDCDTNILELNRIYSGIKLIGKEDELVFKRSVYCKPENNKIDLEIFLDRASVEVFANQGKYTLTSTIYPTKKADNIKITAEGEIEIVSLDKWDIEV